MRVLARIAESIFWFAVWIAIPAALLYPGEVWMLRNTQYSEKVLAESYLIAISVLFLPTGFLVDLLYRKFILKKRKSN